MMIIKDLELELSPKDLTAELRSYIIYVARSSGSGLLRTTSINASSDLIGVIKWQSRFLKYFLETDHGYSIAVYQSLR